MLGYLSNSNYPTPSGDELAATMLNVPNYLAADSGTRETALIQASDEIDRGMRFQGRKVLYTQPREFPRVAYDASNNAGFVYGPFGAGPVGPVGPNPYLGTGEVFWDWDATNNVPIVPQFILQATLVQADAIIAGTRTQRLDQINDGIKSQRTGPLSEDYDTGAPGVRTGLCRRAHLLIKRYQIVSGRIL